MDWYFCARFRVGGIEAYLFGQIALTLVSLLIVIASESYPGLGKLLWSGVYMSSM